MTVALVGSFGTIGSPQPTFAQPTTAGNLLVLLVASSGGAATFLSGASAGWVRALDIDTASGGYGAIFYKPNCGAAETAPTVNQFTAAVLGEFSGADTVSPLDQAASSSSAVSPAVTTMANADAVAGSLLVSVSSWAQSKGNTVTTSDTFNNGATAAGVSTDALSVLNHPRFSWGITTGNSVADSDSAACDSMSLVAISGFGIASFSPPPPPPSFAQQGALRNDPDSLQNIGQAVKRSAYFCLGEKWTRRKSGIVVPSLDRVYALA